CTPTGSVFCTANSTSNSAAAKATITRTDMNAPFLVTRLLIMKPACNSDAAFFWMPAFAGTTSCPPFDFAQDRLRRASSVRAVWETAMDLVQAASELCAVFGLYEGVAVASPRLEGADGLLFVLVWLTTDR